MHIVVTLEFPAFSEYIAYLKDQTKQQKLINDLSQQINQLTDKLKTSGVTLAATEEKQK